MAKSQSIPIALIMDKDLRSQALYQQSLGGSISIVPAITIEEARTLFQKDFNIIVIQAGIASDTMVVADAIEEFQRRRFLGSIIGVAQNGRDRGLLQFAGCKYTATTAAEAIGCIQKIFALTS